MPADSLNFVFAFFATIIASITGIFVVFLTRNLARQDKTDEEDRDNVRRRLSEIEGKSHEQDLLIQARISRDELDRVMDKVYGEITKMETSMTAKLDTILKTVLDALSTRA